MKKLRGFLPSYGVVCWPVDLATCAKCGKEETVPIFSFDPYYCSKCLPYLSAEEMKEFKSAQKAQLDLITLVIERKKSSLQKEI